MTSLNIIKDKTWLVALVCTLFVTYPNVAWFFCGMLYDSTYMLVDFLCLFAFRLIFVWATFLFLIKQNLKAKNHSLGKSLIVNFVASMLFFGVFWVARMPFKTFEAISIPIFQFLVVGLLSAMIGHIYKLYISQREKDKEIERLHIENLQSRCDALSNQINPHFFFNSLNGIVSLIRANDNSRTLTYVDKLSDIFRYTLRSDKKTIVSLKEELQFVNAFSHVMQVRFANKLEFNVVVDDAKLDLNIPVLSLLPLLENVAVHNTIDSEHKMVVSIVLNDKNELVISNPIYPKLTPPETNGTGLTNLENRFRLMMNKEIRVTMTEEVFTVYLPLK